MLDEILQKRLDLIDRFRVLFQLEIEPHMTSKYIKRGLVQGKLFKLCNLPRTGLNMKLVNEAVESLGYKKVHSYGYHVFKKR